MRWGTVGLSVLAVLLLATPAVAAKPSATTFASSSPTRFLVTAPWENILSATVQKHAAFLLEMRLGAPLPAHPPLSGTALLEWTFFFDTNNSTAAKGWPYPSHIPNAAEYMVSLWWNGSTFTAGVIDRTPLLVRAPARVTEIGATIRSDMISFVVPPRLLGNPSHFGFYAITASRTQNDLSINAANRTITPIPVNPMIFGLEVYPQTLVPFYPRCVYTDSFGSCWSSWNGSVAGTSVVAALGVPDWLDIVDSTVRGTNLIEFDLQLGAAVPSPPTMLGSKLIGYLWGIDTLRLKSPYGWPFLPGTNDESEYYVTVISDGTTWAASVFNESPLYSSASPTVTPVHFRISGANLSVWVPWSLLGFAKNMGVVAVDGLFFAPFLKIVSPVHLVEQAGTDSFTVPSVGAFPPNCDYIGTVNGDCFTTYHP